jgi:hypothetical protein
MRLALLVVVLAIGIVTFEAFDGGAPQREVDAAQVTAEPTGTPAIEGDDNASDWVTPVLVGGAAMLLATAFGGWYLVRRG